MHKWIFFSIFVISVSPITFVISQNIDSTKLNLSLNQEFSFKVVSLEVDSMFTDNSQHYILDKSPSGISSIIVREDEILTIDILNTTIQTSHYHNYSSITIEYENNADLLLAHITVNELTRNSFFVIPDWDFFENYFKTRETHLNIGEFISNSVYEFEINDQWVKLSSSTQDNLGGQRNFGIEAFYDLQTGIAYSIKHYYNSINADNSSSGWVIHFENADNLGSGVNLNFTIIKMNLEFTLLLIIILYQRKIRRS